MPRRMRLLEPVTHSYLTIIQPGADGNPGEEEQRDLALSLFNLGVDPGETANLAAQYPDVVNRLTKAASAFDADIKRNQRPPGRL
jgi:arylsulfatase A